MAFNNRGFQPNASPIGSKEIFDIGSGKLADTTLDLPSKLTILLKKGLGRKYISDPSKLDAPTKKKHQVYLQAQFQQVSYDKYIKTLNIDIDRKKSMLDFSAMEYTPEISSALDIFADECTVENEYGTILEITSDNIRVKKILTNLFEEILDVDHNLWHWIRSMCKFGDHFALLDIKPGKGIVGFVDLDPEEIRREEAYDGNVKSVKFPWDVYNTEFAAWQIGHFRLTTDQRRLPYGTSSLESARIIWKQLTLGEDAMMIYRISRAPERRVFYIDVGNIDPSDVAEYVNNIKNSIKRAPQVDQATGSVNQRYNTMAIDEDFFIPRRNDKNSEIDTLAGASNLDEIADIEYLQKKLFAALKVPKAFLTYDEDINAKATLANEDVRFARTINRIQQSTLTTLTQLAVIHLFSLGMRDKEQLMSFSLALPNPSTQNELQKMEVLSEKASVFTDLWDESSLSPISWAWGMKNIFNFSNEEMKQILEQQFLEGKMKLEIEQASTADEEPAEVEGGGGFESQDGQALPDKPPEGFEYKDVEPVSETLLRMMNELDKTKDDKKFKPSLALQSKLDPMNPLNYLVELKMALHEGITFPNLNEKRITPRKRDNIL